MRSFSGGLNLASLAAQPGATYNYQPYDPQRQNLASLTFPAAQMKDNLASVATPPTQGGDRYYSGQFSTGGANQWFDPQGNKLFLAHADLEGGHPTFGYLDDWQNNPNAYADLRRGAAQGDFSDPNQYWGKTPSSDSFVDKAAQLGVQGAALAGTAYGGATALTGAGAGAAGAGATGAAEAGAAGAGLSEGAAWGAGLEGTSGLEAMQGATGLGPMGEYGTTYGLSSGTTDLGGLTPYDLGQDVMPWSTDPSVADLGGAPGEYGASGGYGASSGVQTGGGVTDALLRGLPGVIGAVGSKQQSDAYNRQAQEYLAMGAPSRARYEGSYAPGFTMANDPGFTDALNQSAKATLHGLSVGGNPADSPNAWAQSLQDLYQKNAYPALQNYRQMNAGTGGLAALTAAAPGAASNAINANRGIYDAIGGAAADIFSSSNTSSRPNLASLTR